MYFMYRIDVDVSCNSCKPYLVFEIFPLKGIKTNLYARNAGLFRLSVANKGARYVTTWTRDLPTTSL